MNEVLDILLSPVTVNEMQTAPEPQVFIVRGILFLVFVGLFLYWRKRDAKMTFQAWALFGAMVNLLIVIDALPNIQMLDGSSSLFLQMLLATNSIVAVYKLYLLSEKYIPNKKMVKFTKDHPSHRNMIMRKLHAKTLAVFCAFKEGGNGDHKLDRIKKDIAHRVSHRYVQTN